MRNMIVVVSDLHFEEEQSDTLKDPAPLEHTAFRRNVPASVFEDMMRDVVNMARSNQAARIDLVLAGDIIDLYRTQLWFDGDRKSRPLPFVDCRDVDAALEAKLLAILDAIAAETDVARSSAVFRRFANGEYLATPGGNGTLAKFDVPTALHYIPGNHDRLANATPAIRARVRKFLGLAGSDERFPHYFFSADPPVLIRHGHEYDRYNFAQDLRGARIPLDLPEDWYDKPTFGDFNTVMVAARLPNLFREVYRDAVIAQDPLLLAIYFRLLEFDDVRPQSAVLDFFLNTTVPKTLVDRFAHREIMQKHMWTLMLPVARKLLDELAGAASFTRYIRQFFGFWVRALLWLRPWRLPIPFWLVRRLARLGRQDQGSIDETAEAFAAREIVVHEGTTCFVCAGHTHQPQVVHIYTRNDLKRFFTDTGTWRNAVLTAGDRRSYGRVNATTYVAFYGKHENPELADQPDRGFEYWSGYDQNWPVDRYDH